MATNKCTVDWCDLEKYRIGFDIDVDLIESCQALNLALCALSQILSNDQLLWNFAPHFIPFQQYTGIFPVSRSVSYIISISKFSLMIE